MPDPPTPTSSAWLLGSITWPPRVQAVREDPAVYAFPLSSPEPQRLVDPDRLAALERLHAVVRDWFAVGPECVKYPGMDDYEAVAEIEKLLEQLDG